MPDEAIGSFTASARMTPALPFPLALRKATCGRPGDRLDGYGAVVQDGWIDT